jgi:hypothetical protein
MTTVQIEARNRQQRLLEWAATQPIITQTGWTQRENISYPTSQRDFAAVKDQLEPWRQRNKTQGWMLKRAA